MAKNTETETPTINLIGQGTIIKGDLIANGDIRIDGTLTGTIKSKGKVVIGSTGNIEGEINCQSADISGNIKATINVTELLILKSTSDYTGDMIVGKLAIENGAKFSGTCKMQEQASNSFAKKPVINEETPKE